MKFAYYPGCSAESTARDMHLSTMAVTRALGIELEELAGWTCCGATAAHQTDLTLAAALPAANLLLARDRKRPMVVSCAACYSRMKIANHQVATNPITRAAVADCTGRDYDGSAEVKHLLEVLLEDVGLEAIGAKLKRSLKGLKVASYYGCLLVRPPEVMKFDDPENPTSLDQLVALMGGEALDWPHKVECCGGGLSLTRSDIAVGLSGKILEMASDAGADCIAVACPMCQINLDLRQREIEKKAGRTFNLPILYFTQLLGICLGIEGKELGMNKLVISPDAVLSRVGV